MIKLAIKDIIGFWGVKNTQIEDQLKPIAAGEEIEIEIDSPGGSVFECISIFNTIREYAKSHSVSVYITGMASSAASIIAIAARTVNSQSKLQVSENSIFFIHNPLDYAQGDYRAMQKKADYLQRLAAMFAANYSGVSGQTIKKVQEAMNAETYYIGKEIQEAGYANSLEIINKNADNTSEARAALIATAEMSFAETRKKINESETADDLEKAAALLEMAIQGEKPPKNSGGSLPAEPINEKPGEIPPAGGKVEKMNPDELLAQHPECYKAVFALGEKAERERVTAHLKLAEASQSFETAAKFIKDGSSTMTEAVQSEYLALRINAQLAKDRLGDNPPPTNPAEDNADDSQIMAAFESGYSGKPLGRK